MGELTRRDIETLRELEAATTSLMRNPMRKSHEEGWAMPMDCGGSNGSHHSYTLSKLAKRGLCDRKKFGGPREKGSCRYRINDAGRAYLAAQRS